MNRQETLKRLCIYVKDIQLITGRSESYGRRLLAKIKNHFKKESHHLITLQEFCNYTGIHIDHVMPFMKFC